jgi:hypothetical protein
MRHTSAAYTPVNRKANIAEQTAAELAAIEHELRIYSDGGCDGNAAAANGVLQAGVCMCLWLLRMAL